MAITLTGPLLTAQTAMNRMPYVDIVVSRVTEDIPLEGTRLTATTNNEQSPEFTVLADGRLFGVFRDYLVGYVRYQYTDVERTVWSYGAWNTPNITGGSAIVDMGNENVGVVWVGGGNLYYRISSYEGTSEAQGTVFTFDSTRYTVESPSVVKLSGGTYYLAYVLKQKNDPTTQGTYSGAANATFTVEVTTSGNETAAVFQWKKDSGSWNTGVTATGGWQTLQEGVQIKFDTSYYWVGQSWTVRAFAGNDTVNQPEGYWASMMVYRTSTDFTSWGSETLIDISNIDDYRLKRSLSLTIMDDDSLMLMFDYATAHHETQWDVTNIFYSNSSDGGSTWSAATAVTTETKSGIYYTHPVLQQREDGYATVVYDKNTSVLWMDRFAAGWNSSAMLTSDSMHYDITNQKLYMVTVDPGYAHGFRGVVKIDVNTWTIDNFWNHESLPAYNSYFNVYGAPPYYNFKGDAEYACFCAGNAVVLINGETDTITEYWFWNDNAEWGWTKNVDYTSPGGQSYNMVCVNVDASNLKIYVTMQYSNYIIFGYLPIGGSPPYNFTEIFTTSYHGNTVTTHVTLYPEQDIVLLNGAGGIWGGGKLEMRRISDGNLIRGWTNYPGDPWHNDSFPGGSLQQVVIVDNHIYGAIVPNMGFNMPWRPEGAAGLCSINLSTDVIQYIIPPWDGSGSYGLYNIFQDGQSPESILLPTGSKLAVYTPSTGEWVTWTSTELPSLHAANSNAALYAPDLNMYFMGTSQYANEWGNGINGWSKDGNVTASKYQESTYDTGILTLADQDNYLRSIFDTQATLVVDPDFPSFYSFWNKKDPATGWYKVYWDKEFGQKSLQDYLSSEHEITIEKTIDGMPDILTFTLSHGYLFDVLNYTSLYSIYIRRGFQVIVFLGDIVDDIVYSKQYGEYVIVGSKVTNYKVGEYPSITVECQDRRALWDHEVIATDIYAETAPKDAVTDLLEQFGGETVDTYDIATGWGDAYGTVNRQFVHLDFREIMNTMARRYCSFFKMTWDGNLSIKPLVFSGTSNNTWTTSVIESYLPDSTYANFTNRIIVKGESSDLIDVVQDEEAITSRNGMAGWWGSHKGYQIYYSDDHLRRCRNPRLELTEYPDIRSTLWLGTVSVKIWIDEQDQTTDYAWCHVRVDGPDFVKELVAVLLLYIMVASMRPIAPFTPFFEAVFIARALSILGCMAPWQFTLYAMPLARVKQQFEGQADDIELQQDLGRVVQEIIEDPSVNTLAIANLIAEWELNLRKYPRRNVLVTKMTDLRDEVGDLITLPHPWSGAEIQIVVTRILRRIKRAEGPMGDGYYLDEVEGWGLL